MKRIKKVLAIAAIVMLMAGVDSIRDVMNRPPISPLNPHRYEIADRRNAKLSNLNQKLSSMQQRKQEVIRQIAQLQEKLR